MKKTMLICGLLLFLIVAWFAVGRHEPKQASPARAESPQPDQARRESGSVPPVAAEKVTSPEDAENDALEAASAAERERDRQEREEISARQYNTPITFYGVVLDLTGQPVPRAAVKYMNADITGDWKWKDLVAGENGSFTVTGVRGRYLDVNVTHPAYYDIAESRRSFTYAGNDRGPDYRPDPTKREIFRLRKKGEAAELVRETAAVFLEEGESERSFSLFDHTRRRDRPEYVIIRAVDRGRISSRGKHLLELELSVPGGGLQLRTDPFQFTAPSDGYSESVIAPPNAATTSVDFFARFGSGNFARFTIAGAGREYDVESYLNPDGSPNLEYDPAREINFVRNHRMGIDLVYPPKDEPPPKP